MHVGSYRLVNFIDSNDDIRSNPKHYFNFQVSVVLFHRQPNVLN